MKNSKSRNPHIKVDKFADRNISPLESHPRDGKKLKNPFSRISNVMTPRSWLNECIPNILWGCILAEALERTEYLALFRSVIINTREHLKNYEETFITHNHLTRLSDKDFDIIFSKVFANKPAMEALPALLLADSLPDKSHWQRNLAAPGGDHWQILARAVAGCFDHQSQKATDIRWLKLMHMAIMGRVRFPPDKSEFVEELRLYPDRGDMRLVRPTIRAAEIAFRTFEFGEEGKIELPEAHSETFWSEMHTKTQCMPDDQLRPHDTPKEHARELLDIAQKLADHFHSTIGHTGIDARHDSSFGLAFYAIQALTEACIMYNHSAAIGRSVLRTIIECFITLAYLEVEDDQALWLKHRDYGSGQAKLAFLKNLRSENVPKFINLERLEGLANEDRWLEFSDIQLGSWSELNLRTMAEEANVKEIYDNYYDFCSSYTHGNWAAIRDASFITCWNPLHRFHKIPAPPNMAMPSIVPDGMLLINRMLDKLEKLYPDFEHRLSDAPLPDSEDSEVVDASSKAQPEDEHSADGAQQA